MAETVAILEPYVKNLTLENGLLDLELYLNKAEFIQQDIDEGYFGYDDPTGHETDLMWEYHRGQIKANIVSDYLFKIRQKLAELDAYISNAELKMEVKTSES